MIFSKQELESNYPLAERLKVERAKTQNHITFWINELIATSIPGVEDVPSLLRMTKGLVEQVEDLYTDKETESQDAKNFVASLEAQVEALYKEKEELMQAFPGARTTEDIIQIAKGLEAQTNSLYAEKEGKE